MTNGPLLRVLTLGLALSTLTVFSGCTLGPAPGTPSPTAQFQLPVSDTMPVTIQNEDPVRHEVSVTITRNGTTIFAGNRSLGPAVNESFPSWTVRAVPDRSEETYVVHVGVDGELTRSFSIEGDECTHEYVTIDDGLETGICLL